MDRKELSCHWFDQIVKVKILLFSEPWSPPPAKEHVLGDGALRGSSGAWFVNGIPGTFIGPVPGCAPV